ncbi:MAG: oxidoreductase [Maribacter sp.]|nr:oxidoreductase [Maribacter sp.]
MKYTIVMPLLCFCLACGEKKTAENVEPQLLNPKEVKLMVLDPGHFHAALVCKTMYTQVDTLIHVFAPEGPEVQDFLSKIASYNTRQDAPTAWKPKTYLGPDYFNTMVAQKPGNVVVIAGKNSKKIDYILEAVKAGLNVYADKPLVIDPQGFKKLKMAFEIAKKNDVLIYDIMTERFEVTTAMQKLFSTLPGIFGTLLNGTPNDPAISKESIHHFFKYVSGQPLVRPPWFFDVNEEGEGIVDVTTHLVDLVQWEAFPGQIIDTTNIEMIHAKRWPTVLSKTQFQNVTGLDDYPTYLNKELSKEGLKVFSNGEMLYKINGKYAKVSVIWNYEAPEGTGDTHFSIMRGTKSNLVIKQGKDEDFLPTLYVESQEGTDLEKSLQVAIANVINVRFPGTTAEKMSDSQWKITIPDTFKIGHEAHFAQVTQNYLKYLEKGNLPDWEVPNMIAKYYTTVAAYKMALETSAP